MTANMIDEQAIIDALEPLLSAVPNVQAVYDGVPSSITQYPSIILTPNEWSDEYEDQRDTTVNMSFKVSIYVNIQTATQTAQQTLRAVVKAVRDVLGDQANITLGNLIDSSRATQGQYIFDQLDASLYFCDITYNVRKRFSRR